MADMTHGSAGVLGWPPDLLRDVHRELISRNPLRRLLDNPGVDVPPPAVSWLESHNRVPSLSVLEDAVGCAYRATLTQEEGRPTTFRLAFIDMPEASNGGFVIGLETPLKLTEDAIRRLAPAADAGNTYLAVDTTEDHASIWGIISLPAAESSVNRPLAVVIRGDGPGRLTVTSANSEVLIVHASGALLLNEDRPDEGIFIKIITEALGAAEGEFAAASVVLLRLALLLGEHGHGGTLLVVDPVHAAHNGTRIKYHVSPGTTNELSLCWNEDQKRNGKAGVFQRSQLNSISEYKASDLLDRSVRRSLDDALSAVARFSAVDGAILMTSDLELLGFGSFIDMSDVGGQESVVIVDALDPERRSTEPRAELGGARHQSALSFIESFSGYAIAFVASQDGILTLLAKTVDGQLLAFRPLLPHLR